MSTFRRNEVGEVSIRVMRPQTIPLFEAQLDSLKVLLTKQGYHRDWRGLAELAGLDVAAMGSGKISPTKYTMNEWGKKGGCVKELWLYLETMDRFDVIDDTLEAIYSDYDRVDGKVPTLPPPDEQIIDELAIMDSNILTIDDKNNLANGMGLQSYDALVLSSDEDSDFVQEMVEKLEGEYNLKLVLKDRDLLGGLHLEPEIIVRLITERCNRVIVVLSPEFLNSNTNIYFTNFAQSLSIEQRRRILIPCLTKPCQKPALISFCHSLDYYRAKGYWNYWEKLRDSIETVPMRTIRTGTTLAELPSPSSPTLQTPSSPSAASTAVVGSLAGIDHYSSTPNTLESPSTISPDTSASSSSRITNFSLSKLFKFSNTKSKSKERILSETDRENGISTVNTMSSSNYNMHNNSSSSSQAIPITRSQSAVMQLKHDPGESRDCETISFSLPDAPVEDPIMISGNSFNSPLSSSSSAALLIPDREQECSPRNKFMKMFNPLSRQKKREK